MADSEQSQVLRRQISEVKRLVQHFNTLRDKVGDLIEKAPHDPVAAERLIELEQLWNNGMQQKAEQMQHYIKEVLQASAQYQQIRRQANNDSAEVKSSGAGDAPTAQKSRISKKTRRFA